MKAEIIKAIEAEIERRKCMEPQEQVDICYGLNRAKDVVSAMPEVSCSTCRHYGRGSHKCWYCRHYQGRMDCYEEKR